MAEHVVDRGLAFAVLPVVQLADEVAPCSVARATTAAASSTLSMI